jgi:hypothetical protein
MRDGRRAAPAPRQGRLEQREATHGWSRDENETSFNYEDIVSEKENPYKIKKAQTSLGLYSIRISQKKFEDKHPEIPLGERITNAQMLIVLQHAISASKGRKTVEHIGPKPDDIAVTTSWEQEENPSKQTVEDLYTKVEDVFLKEIRDIKKNIQKSLKDIEIEV